MKWKEQKQSNATHSQRAVVDVVRSFFYTIFDKYSRLFSALQWAARYTAQSGVDTRLMRCDMANHWMFCFL